MRAGWTLGVSLITFAITAWIAPRVWKLEVARHQLAAEMQGHGGGGAGGIGLPCCPVSGELPVTRTRVREYLDLGRGHDERSGITDAGSSRLPDLPARAGRSTSPTYYYSGNSVARLRRPDRARRVSRTRTAGGVQRLASRRAAAADTPATRRRRRASCRATATPRYGRDAADPARHQIEPACAAGADPPAARRRQGAAPPVHAPPAPRRAAARRILHAASTPMVPHAHRAAARDAAAACGARDDRHAAGARRRRRSRRAPRRATSARRCCTGSRRCSRSRRSSRS